MRFAFLSFVLALFAVAGAQQTIATQTPALGTPPQGPPPPGPPPGPPPPRLASPGTPAPTITPQRPTPQRSTSPRTPLPRANAPKATVPGPSGYHTPFPFPPLMPPVAGGLGPFVPFRTNDLTRRRPRDLYRVRRGTPFNSQLYPFVGGYGDGYVGSVYPTPEYGAPGYQGMEQSSPAPAFGMLRLNVTPASAQVFVDSYYAGTIADIEDRGVLTLVAGPHRIELRAQHYEPVTFDVRIDPNDTIVYRAALDLSRPPAPAAPRAPGASRIYVIPGCYAGNIAPRAYRLPAGCDIKLVRVLDGPQNQP